MSKRRRTEADYTDADAVRAQDASDVAEAPPASDDTSDPATGRESGAVAREGMLTGPGLELRDGERQAQCYRCGLSVVTATPPDDWRTGRTGESDTPVLSRWSGRDGI